MAGPGVLIPRWPDLPANVGALATTRGGGVSEAQYGDGAGGGGLNLGQHVGDDPDKVQRNRALLASVLPCPPAWISQVHGVAVVDALAVVNSCSVPEADASIASAPGAACVVMTADCLPVLFADTQGKVVGAAHAGWRGLASGVLGQTVRAMRAAGAGDITAWLGPAIGPDKFEVGAEVRSAFLATASDEAAARAIDQAFAVQTGGKYLANIYALARCMLAVDGVEQLAGGEHCTVTEQALFYSYRREAVTGRQASLIWLK